MLIAGIIGQDGKMQTASLINFILSSTGRKVSLIDLKNLSDLDSYRIKGYLHELVRNNTEILLLKINSCDANEKILKYFRFDIFMCTDTPDQPCEITTDINNLLDSKPVFALNEKGMIIVNIDDIGLIHLSDKAGCCIVTYGFNSKADITASSIGDTVFEDSFMCCLQKAVSTRNGYVVEPQEYRLDIKLKEIDVYSVLAASAFAIVTGVNFNTINCSYSKMRNLRKTENRLLCLDI